MTERSSGRTSRSGRFSGRYARHGIDASFENMIHAATGGEILDTSLNTIYTSKLETAPKDPERNVPADPDGVILDDDYSGIFDDSRNLYNSYLDQESQRVLSDDDDDDSEMNTTCPTDSFDSKNERLNQNTDSIAKRSRPTPKNRSSLKSKRAVNKFDTSFGSDIASPCGGCKQNFLYCLLCLAVLLVGLSISGTAMYFMGVFPTSLFKTTPSNATAAENVQQLDTASDDLVGPVTVTVWTKPPTLRPTQAPSFNPTKRPTLPPQGEPSATPTGEPSAAPAVLETQAPTSAPTFLPTSAPTFQPNPTAVPTGRPSSAPSLISPTQTPSMLPTNIASATPSTSPTNTPTRAPIDMAESRFFSFLRDAVEDASTLTDVNTPQGRALEWLEKEDQIELDILEMDANTPEASKERMYRNLYQRFALLALDFALHDTVETTAWSFPRLDVCFWTGTTCNTQQEVNGINWARMNLTGTIPAELGLLSTVVSLDLAQNQLKGTLEPLYNLTNAKDIFVFENQLSGPLTRGLENCQKLSRFMAGHNQLEGQLPSLIMEDLHWFNVHHNSFTGSIPSTMSLDNVELFDISGNNISGQIPFNFVVDVVPNIRHLNLGHNQLNGTIPSDFVNLGRGRVHEIYMNDNQLSGGFPTHFEEIKHLTNLDLSNNLFTQRLGKMCRMSVFEYGELVEMRADCRICNCDRICRTCYDNINHLYDYDDDTWIFDDDTLWDDGAADDDDEVQVTAVGHIEVFAADDDEEDEDDFFKKAPDTRPVPLENDVEAREDDGGPPPPPQLNIINGDDDDEDPFWAKV